MPRKALLLVDNCSGHGTPEDNIASNDGQICLFFLPANTTAVIQPMDQNPIRLTKLKYRKSLANKILAHENVEIDEILKKHTIKDAVILLNIAWNELSDVVLVDSWKPILEWRDNDFGEDDLIPLNVVRNQVLTAMINEVQVVLHRISDADLLLNEFMQWNDDELSENDADDLSEDDSTEEVEESAQTKKVSHSDAIHHVNQ